MVLSYLHPEVEMVVEKWGTELVSLVADTLQVADDMIDNHGGGEVGD